MAFRSKQSFFIASIFKIVENKKLATIILIILIVNGFRSINRLMKSNYSYILPLK